MYASCVAKQGGVYFAYREAQAGFAHCDAVQWNMRPATMRHSAAATRTIYVSHSHSHGMLLRCGGCVFFLKRVARRRLCRCWCWWVLWVYTSRRTNVHTAASECGGRMEGKTDSREKHHTILTTLDQSSLHSVSGMLNQSNAKLLLNCLLVKGCVESFENRDFYISRMVIKFNIILFTYKEIYFTICHNNSVKKMFIFQAILHKNLQIYF